MKKLLLAPLALCFFLADAQINMPQPSPAGSVSSRVGLTDVEVNYFRPKVKGRQIFGTGDQYLEQYDRLWRTGANSGSRISFSTDVMMGDATLAAGEYLLLSRPGADSWDVIFYKDPSIGGNMSRFNDADVAATVKVTPMKLTDQVETLTFNISDISEDNTNANLHFAWADVSWKLPFSVNFDETVMAEIAEKTAVNPQNYVQAASYYFNAGKDLNQALEWVNTYLAVGNNSRQFWNVHLKAQILAKLGQDEEAIATAEDSMAKAKANEGGDFGYVKRNEALIAEIKGK